MATIILVEHAGHKSGDLGPIVTTGTWPGIGHWLRPLRSSLRRQGTMNKEAAGKPGSTSEEEPGGHHARANASKLAACRRRARCGPRADRGLLFASLLPLSLRAPRRD